MNSKRCLSSALSVSFWQKFSLSVLGVTIMNVRQAQPLGLGHSILCARPVVGDNPFIVVLPDIIIDNASADPLRYNLAAMVARFNETGRSRCWRNV